MLVGSVVVDGDDDEEADADWESAVVAVAQAYHILIASVRAAKYQDAEVSVAVGRYAVVLFADFVAEVGQAMRNEIDEPMMWYWYMSCGSRRGFEFSKVAILDGISASM